MHGPDLNIVFARIGEKQAPLPASTAVVIGCIAFLLVTSGANILVKYLDTIAHEGAHALVGWGLGHRIKEIIVEPNGDGLTRYGSGGGPLGYLLAAIVGYLGPSGFGLGAAKLIATGHPVAALWAGLFLLILMALTVKNLFSTAMVLVVGGLTYLTVRYFGIGFQVTSAYVLTWILLLHGIRTVVKHNRNAGDAGILARMTNVPKVIWVVIWFAGSTWALLLGGDLLVMGN